MIDIFFFHGSTLWLNILSLILLGIFVSMAYLPTYHALLHYAK